MIELNFLMLADIIGSILILVGLWLSAKSPQGWLVYCTGTIFFLFVTITKGLPGLTAMGIATFFIGLRNLRYKR
jgi:hypothetical protein